MTDTPAPDAAPAAAPSLDFNTYVSALPDTHKELLTKNGVDSFEKQEKWISGLNTLIGKKGILPPDENAPDEDKQKYRETLMKELGRPDTGEYEFALPEGSNNEYYTDDFMNGLADIAYKNGMSQQGYQDVVNYLASGFNGVLTQWEKTIGEINSKLGEDKMSDNAETKTNHKAEVHQAAKAKMIEANDLYRKGDYKGAQLMKQQADELYSKL
jgi:hypothetical protein